MWRDERAVCLGCGAEHQFLLLTVKHKPTVYADFKSEDDPINNYSMAPDNSTFYYTLNKIEANIWLLAIE